MHELLGQGTDQLSTVELNGIRRSEALAIEDAGSLVASTRAAVLFYMGGLPLEEVLKSKREILANYGSMSRDQRIQLISDTEELGRKVAQTLNPHCRETSYAFHARKLDIISAVIRAGITYGYEAVDLADFLMGSLSFKIDALGLVKEWKEKNGYH